jgi:hypothetical protein
VARAARLRGAGQALQKEDTLQMNHLQGVLFFCGSEWLLPHHFFSVLNKLALLQHCWLKARYFLGIEPLACLGESASPS